MHESDYKADWLFGNSLIAFIGALLLAQVWEPSRGTFKLLFFFDVPAYNGLFIFLIIAGMVVLSIVLAAASVIPRLREFGLKLGVASSTILDFIVWLAFIVSWGSSAPELPLDQWWSRFLIVIGLVFFFFIPIRNFARLARSSK